MAQQGVRFARIHGRIVPIHASTQSDRNKQYRHMAAVGVGAGALSAVSAAFAGSRSKFGLATGALLGATAVGTGIGMTVGSIVRGSRAKKGTRARTGFGNYFSGLAGSLAGNALGAGVVGAGVLAMRGIRKIRRP